MPVNDNHIVTWTGKSVNPFDLNSNHIDIEDIAHSLAHQCRWMGHIKEFYSIAQHSVLVSLYCDPFYMLEGLLHDASEAYLMDVPRPIKRHPAFKEYRVAELKAERAIEEKFKALLGDMMPESVKEADTRMLLTEARDLRPQVEFFDGISNLKPYRRAIYPWSPETAKRVFLMRFNMIMAYPNIAVKHSQEWQNA